MVLLRMGHCQAKPARNLIPGVGTGSPFDNATNLAPVDKLAIGGVNGRNEHFAIARQQSQHIDQIIAAMAESGSDQLGPVAVFAQGFDGLGEFDGLVIGDRGALFGLAQAGARRRVGSSSRPGEQTEQNGGGKDAWNRHGRISKRAPVNTG